MQPVTPHFKTDVRAQHTCRPLPLSFEEQEEALLLEMQSHSFKAKPVNKRIFQSMGELGKNVMCLCVYLHVYDYVLVFVCVCVCVYMFMYLCECTCVDVFIRFFLLSICFSLPNLVRYGYSIWDVWLDNLKSCRKIRSNFVVLFYTSFHSSLRSSATLFHFYLFLLFKVFLRCLLGKSLTSHLLN